MMLQPNFSGGMNFIFFIISSKSKPLSYAEIQKQKEVDYFQVFKLSRERNEQGLICQKIIHKQEVPPLEDVCYLVTDEAVNETVFCIDDETHHTFLLASEY